MACIRICAVQFGASVDSVELISLSKNLESPSQGRCRQVQPGRGVVPRLTCDGGQRAAQSVRSSQSSGSSCEVPPVGQVLKGAKQATSRLTSVKAGLLSKQPVEVDAFVIARAVVSFNLLRVSQAPCFWY